MHAPPSPPSLLLPPEAATAYASMVALPADEAVPAAGLNGARSMEPCLTSVLMRADVAQVAGSRKFLGLKEQKGQNDAVDGWSDVA